MTVKLNRDAATALMAEARREFENAAEERWGRGFRDMSQEPNLAASTEIIGSLSWQLKFWPLEDTPGGSEDQPLVEFEFTTETLDWIERKVPGQEGFVSDLDKGSDRGEPGYLSEQVYILHVLRSIAAQGKEVAA